MEEVAGMKNIKNKILVLSGKGGVGKSTVCVNLAAEFLRQGKKVGILDIDLCGPSIPHLLGLNNKDIHQGSAGLIPVYSDNSKNLAVMVLNVCYLYRILIY